jgi:hypothetical protein
VGFQNGACVSADLLVRLLNVNEVTADPESIHTGQAGATIDVYRRAPAPLEWPYHPERDEQDGERVRTRLLLYQPLANRGHATMGIWLPISTRRSSAPSPAPGALRELNGF